MNLLQRLKSKAQSWLSKPVPVAPATQAVVQDRFGQALFRELLDEAPALATLVADLNVKYDYTDDLVSDVFAQFYQAAPMLRPAGDMAVTHLVNHAVATSLSQAPETSETRPYTQHDKYAAAMTTIGVGDKIREYLKQHKEVADNARKAEEAQQQAQQADSALSQALESAEQWEDALAQAFGDFDGNGPLTEQQAVAQAALDAAAQTLAQAQKQAEKAAKKAAQADDRAQQTAQKAQQELRAPLRQAVQEAAEQLAEEADLFRGWGVDPGQVSRMSFEERRQLAARLRSNRLSQYVNQLGRWKLMAAAQRAKKVTPAREEVYDTELSGRLPDVLASEFVHLGTRMGQVDFVVRLTERQLLSRKYRGEEHVGQGAIIACVDTSSSMQAKDRAGITREAWAKGLALAALDQARAQRRDFVGILFSSRGQQRVFRFPKGQGELADVLAFAELAFNGGTHFEAPLDLAIDVLERDFSDHQRARGDLLFITDDECRVSPGWLDTYRDRKQRLGFRTYGIAVGMPAPGSTLVNLSDDVRAVTEFVDPTAVADIFRTV